MAIFEVFLSDKPVIPVKGEYMVYDNMPYQISYTTNSLPLNIEIFLEDYLISRSEYIIENNIISISSRIFSDTYGLVDLSICGDIFSFNVKSKKLDIKEIESMISYVYEKNDKIISTFFSKSKSQTSKSEINDTTIPFSSKFLNKLKEILFDYEYLYQNFLRNPYTVVRKKSKIVNYGDTPKDYQIDWLLNNLDEIQFDPDFEYLPNSILIDNEFGWIDKIQVQENFISYDNYENQIILGGLKSIQNILYDCIDFFTKLIKEKDEIENDGYYDFRSSKIVQYIYIKEELKKIEDQYYRVSRKYKSLFKNVKCTIGNPRYTSVFKFYSHYRQLFEDIKWLFESNYTFDGALNLISLRKVFELYELFNLYTLIEALDQVHTISHFDKEIIYHNNSIDYVKYKFENLSVTLYYHPIIDNFPKQTSLVVLGNFKNENKQYVPDYIIEISNGKDFNYGIIDAKYSRSSSVRKYSILDCSRKYLLDIGIFKQKYRKSDFLLILNPEKSDEDFKIDINLNYCPQIGSIAVKPNNFIELYQFTNKYVSDVISLNVD